MSISDLMAFFKDNHRALKGEKTTINLAMWRSTASQIEEQLTSLVRSMRDTVYPVSVS
jgi:hypothetical protein